jgi:hypothetical protein
MEEHHREDVRLALRILRRLYGLAPLVYDLDGIEATDWRAAIDRAGLWPGVRNPSTRRCYFKRVKDRLLVAGLIDSKGRKYRPVGQKHGR